MSTSIKAVDWGMYGEQVSRDTDFQLIVGWVHGEVIKETSDLIAIAHQVFDGGDVRHVVVIPKVCILERRDHTAEGPPVALTRAGLQSFWQGNSGPLV